MSEKLEIIITGDGKSATSALDGVKASTKGLDGAFKLLSPSAANTSSSVETLAKQFSALGPQLGVSAEATAAISSKMVALAPAIGAVVVAIGIAVVAFAGLKAAIDLAVAAAPLESIQLGFDITAAKAGAMGDDVLAAMQKASGGMISMEKLMMKFNDASQLVSPDFALMLADAMEPLQKVAATTGASMDYLLGSFVTGVGRLSPLILDNLRITFDAAAANREYARSLGISADALTKQQQQMAAATYTIKLLKENTDGLPSSAMSAAGIMARLTASFEDLKRSVGLAGLPILTEVARVLGGPLSDAMRAAADGFRDIGIVFRNVFNTPEMREALDQLSASMSELFGQGMQATMKAMVALVSDFTKRWAKDGPEIVRAITDITNEFVRLAMVINRVLDALDKLGIVKTSVTDLQTKSLIAGATQSTGLTVHSGGIPTYASGTNFHPGGLAIVGERGPETVNLPRGSSVHPSGSAATGGIKIYGPTYITAPSDGSLSALMQNLEAAATATI